MKHVIIALLTALGLFGVAHAEDVQFSGTLADSCTISGIAPGTLAISPTSFSTDVLATATVVNNSAGVFQLGFTAPTAWDSFPNSYTGTTSFNGGFSSQGANQQASLVQSLVLTNAGTDNLSIQIDGTSDSTYTAGNYNATSVIVCSVL